MKRAVALLFTVCLACSDREANGPDERGAQPRVETARAFFGQLGDEPAHLSGEASDSATRREAYNWLHDATAHTSPREPTGFIVRRLSPRSQSSYALRLHRTKGYPELAPEKRYVEVHLLHGASDPEVHGIIDVDEMEVVSIFEDGGA